MLPLAELQSAFARGLAGGSDALPDVIAGDSISAGARVRIHRNHVRQSLAAALSATFPTVVSLVGDGFFRAMAAVFVADRLPEGPVLTEYGSDFPAFVAAFSPARGLPYLGDAARLDWALNLAFHAAPGLLLDMADLEGLSSDELVAYTPCLAPGAALLRSDYPLDRIWQACQPGADAAEVDLAAGGITLLVMRHDDEAVFVRLDDGEAVFTDAILEGKSLGEAAERAMAGSPDFDLSTSFARLLALRVLAPPRGRERLPEKPDPRR